MVSPHQHNHDCDHDSSHGKIANPPHIPSKKILTKEDLERFQKSDPYIKYMGFIERLNLEVRDQPLEKIKTLYTENETSCISDICRLLGTLSSWIDEIPAHEMGLSRFGNPGFRDWYHRVQERMNESLLSILPNEKHREEAGAYLLASFGDMQRIDYGTGHEANFICFLICLKEFNVIPDSNLFGGIALVFWDYIKLMRKLQFTYWLEPAGSHGVWGLDDYQFLPFLFGSSQLTNHKYLRPKSIHDSDMVDELEKDYMYFSCIKHINSIKSASLRWHSPMLDDISGVKKWSKVNEGMFKMYKQEVLNKLPIMQHFLFGSVLSFEGNSYVDAITAQMEHVHALGQERPLCCSIRVPSSIAASQNQKRLPFD